ncbi:hypothetical protein B0H16DRAFT_1456579 [Mycena metata]|uniref:Uncharacterized protein n=1 Tax=Mycena metata TaxID=1033252 RepID=A0AAD7JDT3_9AGAR|nr:hypothetical protein B0H16DRAFT_1456579 [Mycena metata]
MVKITLVLKEIAQELSERFKLEQSDIHPSLDENRFKNGRVQAYQVIPPAPWIDEQWLKLRKTQLLPVIEGNDGTEHADGWSRRSSLLEMRVRQTMIMATSAGKIPRPPREDGLMRAVHAGVCVGPCQGRPTVALLNHPHSWPEKWRKFASRVPPSSRHRLPAPVEFDGILADSTSRRPPSSIYSTEDVKAAQPND